MHPYRPHPLLPSGHLQTLMVGLSSGVRPPHHALLMELPLPDGEGLAIHEELSPSGPDLADDAPLAILIHGLGGDHTSPYLQRIAFSLRQAGLRVWRLDLRGCGQGMKLAWRPAHAGCSSDLAAVVNHATRLYPAAPQRIVGFSLSGNILLKMLGEAAVGQLQPPVALPAIESALAVAPPADLQSCADNMDRASRKIYTHYYLKTLDKQVDLRRAIWPQWAAIPKTPRVRSIREFDARYTVPLSGFRDTEHYYAAASSIGLLPSITTPTTILVDRNDPIVSAKSFQLADPSMPSIRWITTSRGGHMGYFGLDSDGRGIRWMEHFVVKHVLQSGSRQIQGNHHAPRFA